MLVSQNLQLLTNIGLLTSRQAIDKIDTPPWVKRVEDIFDKPQFFIDGASATDVHQGNSGDCWFLAALMAVSAKKDLIDNLCVARHEKAGVYGFVFFRGQSNAPCASLKILADMKNRRRVDSRSH